MVLSDLWEKDVLVLPHDIKAGTANQAPELGWHWDTHMCPVKRWGPSETFGNKVTRAHTDPQRARGADFWRRWMMGMLG